jgi:hypothetical protein
LELSSILSFITTTSAKHYICNTTLIFSPQFRSIPLLCYNHGLHIQPSYSFLFSEYLILRDCQ